MTTEKRIFYSICLISFVGPFLSTSINIAIPVMADQFGTTPDRMSWVVTLFLMTTAAFLLPLGKVSDVHGRRRTYTVSLIMLALTSIAAALAPTLPILIGLRALQGIALAGIYVSYMPLLLATTDESRQGHIIGQSVALTYLGLSLGPVIGGAVTEFIGWRCIFILAALLVLLSYLLIRPVKAEWYENGAPFVNAISSVLSISAILCTLYGLSSFSDNSFFFYAGLVLSVIFVVHEGRSFHPLLPLYLFRSLTFSMSNLAALIQYSATYAVSFLLSLYLQVILGLTPAVSGAVLLIQPLVMALLSPRAGDLSDTYGPRGIASLGLFLTAPGLLVFAVFPDISIGQTALCLAVIGMGAALFGAPNNSAIMGSVKKMHHGIASSVLALSRNLGQAFSMAAVTFIMTSETSQAAVYKDGVLNTPAYRFYPVVCPLLFRRPGLPGPRPFCSKTPLGGTFYEKTSYRSCNHRIPSRFAGGTAVQAFNLGSILKVGGISVLVSKYGDSINDFLNKLLMKNGVGTDYATKVVPILSVGTGKYIGAVQVVGPTEQVDKVKRRRPARRYFNGIARANALIPIESLSVSNLSRVQGVGVSATIDFKF